MSDERIDNRLDRVLEQSGNRLGFVFRHYHLPPQERFDRFRELAAIARRRGHLVILSDSALTAREWGADGIYGAPLSLYPRRRDLIRIATAHDMTEIAQANRLGADAVMLSPLFATRSHPGAQTLGPARFRQIARHANMPVIALGGMDADKARQLDWPRWAAINGLAEPLAK